MNKKDLKCGDIVEVLDASTNSWEERIFIKYYENDDAIICVRNGDEFKFRAGAEFQTVRWDSTFWRIRKELKYIPFTDEELIAKIPFVVKFESGNITTITGYVKSITGYVNEHGKFIGLPFSERSATGLLIDCTFIDGKKIGKLA